MQNSHEENIQRLYEFLKRHKQRFSLNSLLKAGHFALHVEDMRWFEENGVRKNGVRHPLSVSLNSKNVVGCLTPFFPKNEVECQIQFFPEIVELGAGVGLNTFLLAIFCPNKRIVAVEKNLKKVGLMKLCRKELGFHNIAIHTSLDSYIQDCQNHDAVVFIKAFSPKDALPKLLHRVALIANTLYVFEGRSHGLSKLIPPTLYQKVKTAQLPHGYQRFVSTFEVL